MKKFVEEDVRYLVEISIQKVAHKVQVEPTCRCVNTQTCTHKVSHGKVQDSVFDFRTTQSDLGDALELAAAQVDLMGRHHESRKAKVATDGN